jgi:TRAP transporter TAXI family solute receptor
MSIATGGSGGVYQVYGGGVAEMLSANGHPTTAETTSASVDNLFLVADGDSEVAFSLADTAIDAVKGQDSFEGEPLPLRALGTLYSNFTHVVALKDSGIERIEDLKGKTVSIGAPNSGTEVIGLRLMEVAGLDPDKDVTRRALGVGESAAALREGSLDAFVWSGGLPTGAITDLATTDDVVLLPLDAYLPELNERYGEAYVEAEVEAGEYPNVAPVKTISVPNLLMVREDMDPGLAHDLIELMFDHKAELVEVHPSAEKLTLEDAQRVVEPVRLHEGAERFYREAQ